jgi:hypothetical protein
VIVDTEMSFRAEKSLEMHAFSFVLEMKQAELKLYINTGLFKMIVGVWPPRSPDATPCDFFLWGYVKDQVYIPPLPASIPELKVRIRTAI